MLGIKNESSVPARTNQQLGEYCKDRYIEKCRNMFGEGLPKVCASCPG